MATEQRRDVHSQVIDEIHCPQCAYCLRGLASERCPECGYDLSVMRSDVPVIPWARRGEIGVVRAYWLTLRDVLFRHDRFCDAVLQPVGYRDAQLFRWVTIGLVYLPLMAITVSLYAFARPRLVVEFVEPEFGLVWPMVVFQICLALFLVAVTGVQSYFFHPRSLSIESQNRAVAMSYYAGSAVLWLGLPAAVILIGFNVPPLPYGSALLLLVGAILWLAVFPVLACWLSILRIARRVLPQSKRRGVAMAVALPALWGLLAIAIFAGIPVCVFYVFIIFTSVA